MAGGESPGMLQNTKIRKKRKNLYDSKISLAEIFFFLLKATHVLHHPGRTDFNAL